MMRAKRPEGKPCMLKTGMREGPTHLKSFFICSVLNEPCSFSEKAGGIRPIHCQVHKEQYVDLQAVVYSATLDEKRKFFRCPVAIKNKMKWCGYSTLYNNLELSRKDNFPLKQATKVITVAPENNKQAEVDAISSGRLDIKSDKNLSGCKENSAESIPNVLDIQKKKKDDIVEICSQAIPHQSLNNEQIQDQTSSIKDTIMKEADLPIESLEQLSLHRDKTREATVSKTLNTKYSSNAAMGKGNVLHKQMTANLEFVKASSLLPVTKNSTAVNDSMSYRDASVVEVSSDDEEYYSVPSSKGGSEKGDDSDDDDDDAIKTKLKMDSHAKMTHEHNLPSSQIRPSLDTASNVIVLKGDHLSSSSVAAKKPSTVVIIGDGKDDINPELKLLSHSDLLAKQQELGKAVDEYQKLLKSVRGLPDGGQKIKSHIEQLIKEKSQCESLLVKKDASSSQPAIQRHSVLLNNEPARQTKLIEFPTNLSTHSYQQMFGATSHGNLYGGRMTARRLEHVGQVTSEAIEQLHSQVESCPSSEQEAVDPEGLRVPLMIHQKQALTWLVWREQQHPCGGILADDMGLGKTLTMISLILAQRASKDSLESQKAEWFKKDSQKKTIKSAATLVICPASLVHQWQKEIERRVERGLLRIIVYHGANRETNPSSLASADVIITTYNIISKEVGVPEEMKKNRHAQEMPVSDKISCFHVHDLDELTSGESSLLRIFWNRIIIDEAHAIKNYKSLTAMSVSRLRSHCRWALTGTPIHNDLLDMYSLLRFLRCSPFDEYKVWKRQVDNKTEKGTQRLNTLIKTLLLRRTKDQTCPSTGLHLVPLPEKHCRSHELQLSRHERQIYERIYKLSKAVMQQYLQRHEDKFLGRDVTNFVNAKPTNLWSKDDHCNRQPVAGISSSSLSTQPGNGVKFSDGPSSSGNPTPSGGGQILINLLRLRQCCSHLYLLKNALEAEDINSDGMELDLAEQMNDLALAEAPGLKDVKIDDGQSPSVSIDSSSTKIVALLGELHKIRGQSSAKNPMKSVVVSQWTKMLEIVEFHLKREGFRCCTIKGSVPAKQRSDMVDTFNSDPSGPEVMLVSLRAGGVGLNLVGGSHLFVIDMHWNPALELQAQDRIYRVGQKREVFIHRFICKDTIEDKIIQLQKRKTDLANNILSGNSASNNKLTLDDLRLLFGIGMNAEVNQRSYIPSL